MGKLIMRAKGPHTGSGEVTLDLPDYAGPAVEIAFDPVFLTDMLRAVDPSESLTLEMTDGQKPAVFRLGESYLYLVMPLAG